eukprot:Nitzschia sp. Nitz4//scaffold96_size78090//70194//71687//NITZ4_005506-RA/size78090-augustus-gene-0.8-mRNA-1//1//CDS//3329560609//5993//frame0
MSVPHVHPSARPSLVTLVEEHLTGLIREAVTVQRHCKRARVHLPPQTPSNESSATGKTGASNSGASSSASSIPTREPSAKRRLHADDVNMALQWRGSEKIYATSTVGASSSEDRKVNLEDYIKSEMEIRPPQEVGLTVHWLAVDGVQPDIPQNPIPAPSSQPAAGTQPAAASRQETEESDSNGVQVTQLLPRLLSEELQLYFTRITLAIERGGSTPNHRVQQDAALDSVARDSGLQELVPFFVNYVAKSIFQHIGNPEHCCTLVRMARSLLSNPHLHLELHLHQMLPSLLTCVVAERLSSAPWGNHWSLRREATMALAQACNLFGDDYTTLKARILKTLCGAAGPDKCLATQYGGFVAIAAFGPKAINAFLLPLVLEYWKVWEKTLEEGNHDVYQRMEVQMCQQAVLHALGVFLSEDVRQTPDKLKIQWEDMEETFGDRLVVLSREETEYTTCFV